MIVEINLLEKKEKKKLAPYLIGFLAVLCIAAVLGTVYYQVYSLNSELEVKNEYKLQLEKIVGEFQGAQSEQQRLEQLKETIANQKQDAFPTVPMYRNILDLIHPPYQFTNFTYTEDNQFVLDVWLPDFAVSSVLVSKLLNQSYVQDVQLTAINRLENGYHATLTVLFDDGAVKEEFNDYE